MHCVFYLLSHRQQLIVGYVLLTKSYIYTSRNLFAFCCPTLFTTRWCVSVSITKKGLRLDQRVIANFIIGNYVLISVRWNTAFNTFTRIHMETESVSQNELNHRKSSLKTYAKRILKKNTPSPPQFTK